MLLDRVRTGSRWTIVGGKGGVGKTTTAAALAIEMADGGARVLVLSLDPAHSLGDALETPLRADPTVVRGAERLEAMELDPAVERDRFMRDRRGRLLSILERGTYLDAADVEEIVDSALPGIDELAALFRLVELARDSTRRLVIDTAPTGHALRLLDLPNVARDWLAALRAMDDKHRIVADALSRGRVPGDGASALIDQVESDLERLSALLRDPEKTRFVLVTGTGPVVAAESERYADALAERRIALGGIVINRAADVPASALGDGVAVVPELEARLTGLDGLRAFAAAAGAAPANTIARSESGIALASGVGAGLSIGARFAPPGDRTLYMVGGKGGVGKTTAAAAIAVSLARTRRSVLVLSIDPAGSLSEVLEVEVGDHPRPVPGVTRLQARQLDAVATWDAFRDEYREHAIELFDGLVGGGSSATADLRVVERLIDLAPPGIDEVIALLEVIDLTEARPYDAIVIDTAPTGHLLRLLEMPDLALEWTHTIMRLLLKYREVVEMGELGERVLALSRELKTFRSRLSDPEQTWLLTVALPEALSVPESRRLVGRLAALGVPTSAMLVNRAMDGPRFARGAERWLGELADSAGGLPIVAAPDLLRGPRGPAELLDFLGGWRRIEM